MMFPFKVPINGQAVFFNHTDCSELEHVNHDFDHHFDFYFCLRVKIVEDFDASISECDRYKPPLDQMSCHRYVELWQDLKSSIYHLNLMSVSYSGLTGTSKNTFEILVHANNQIVQSGFQTKIKYMYMQICNISGATSYRNTHVHVPLSVDSFIRNPMPMV